MNKEDIWVWVVKLWKRSDCDCEKMNDYPAYVMWVLMHDYSNRFPEEEHDKTWTAGVGYEIPELDEYLCMVVHETYQVGIGQRAPTNEEVSEAIKKGNVIDLTPNEQRMREYEIYKWWLEKYRYVLNLVDAEAGSLIRQLREILM